MPEFNLLRALPNTKRNIRKRSDAKDASVVEIAKQFGEMYFDGPREYGYGGYRYDGRWRPAARDIIARFGLKPGMRVLDVGCAKGFLVKDLMQETPGLEAFGLDVSCYALMHCEPESVGRLHLGTAERLPFPDASFDAVLSITRSTTSIHKAASVRFRKCVALCEIQFAVSCKSTPIGPTMRRPSSKAGA